jgi:hypothetical protein
LLDELIIFVSISSLMLQLGRRSLWLGNTNQIMKFSVAAILATLATASAFAPAASGPKFTNMALNAEAEHSRSAFLVAAGAALFGAAIAPGIANAMDQENVSTPTEVWETGKPSEASKERKARYENARTQMTSNFPPIKRLTLERKSPVTRLDLNAPYFEGTLVYAENNVFLRIVSNPLFFTSCHRCWYSLGYKKTYPGLFK